MMSKHCYHDNDERKDSMPWRMRRIEFVVFVMTMINLFSFSNQYKTTQQNTDYLSPSALREVEDALSPILEEKITQRVLTKIGSIPSAQNEVISTEKKIAPSNEASSLALSAPSLVESSELLYELPNTGIARSRKSASRKLQLDDDLPPCDGSSFHLALELDDFANQTSWELTDEQTNVVVAHQTYGNEDNGLHKIHSECLKPGLYSFSLMDSGEDGIDCKDASGCYEILMNKKLVVEGSPFIRKVSHTFDTNPASLCVVNSIFLLEVNSGLTGWELRKVSGEMVSLTQKFDQFTSSTESYFACLPAGVYTFFVPDLDEIRMSCADSDDCYHISIDDQLIIKEGIDFKKSTHVFTITSDGFTYEEKCHLLPRLAPYNTLSNFQFDERVAKVMDLIHSLTSDVFLSDRRNAQYKAACWIIYDDVLKMPFDDKGFIERYSMAVFLFATGQSAGSIIPSNICDLDELACDNEGFITEIKYPNRGLVGSIPFELNYLRRLEVLKLDHNNLTKNLYAQQFMVDTLRVVDLSHNQITGTIPSQIRRLTNLKELVLRSNQLFGSIPPEIGECKRLEIIDVRINSLNGTIPSNLMSCRSLRILHLDHNKFTGTIPTNIGQVQKMEKLYFGQNLLSGSIPSEIGRLSTLDTLVLRDNKLTGSIPKEIENLENIAFFMLFNNLLNGTVPDVFDNFVQMRSFSLKNNLFSGSIPDSIHELDSLSFVSIGGNNFEGTIPNATCTRIEKVQVDSRTWWVDKPKVKCDCCDSGPCYVWINPTTLEGRKWHPICPKANIKTIPFISDITIEDKIANQPFYELVGNVDSGSKDMCFSPTGCYQLNSGTNLSYSSKTKSLIEQDDCEAVSICGEVFGSNHPKRKGLNHLTTLGAESMDVFFDENSPEHQTLCWIMTQDELFDQYDVCDGTLLQRYVIGLLYYPIYMRNKDEVSALSSLLTCDWDGITCDSQDKFVEEINLSDQSLNGTIFSEIGLLTTLKTLNLRRNKLTGSLNSAILTNLPNLEVLDISDNIIEGPLPSTIFDLPKIKAVNVSSNKFEGNLQVLLKDESTLESLNVSGNLLRGTIPLSLYEYDKLKIIDLSSNNFDGMIPSRIGNLKNLEQIMFQQNQITGSIPNDLFSISNIKVLQLQSNKLTGSIPTVIGNLNAAQVISMSMNSLKGTIPRELENLEKIEYLQFYQNQLTGTAPNIKFHTAKSDLASYITDCGHPSYLLSSPVKCESCTLCCNSDGTCNDNSRWSSVPIEVLVVMVTFAVPLAIAFILFIIRWIKSYGYLSFLQDNRDPLDIYKEESVYCFILSGSKLANLVCVSTYGVQICLLAVFLVVSDFRDAGTVWVANYRCKGDNLNCNNEASYNEFGWLLFYILLFVFLGMDFINSSLQIRKAFHYGCFRLFLSGCGILFLSVLTVYTSYTYNIALAQSNNDLLVNAVILLFINDLDEQVSSAVLKLTPAWHGDVLGDVERKLLAKQQKVEGDNGDDENSNAELSSETSKEKDVDDVAIFESYSDDSIECHFDQAKILPGYFNRSTTVLQNRLSGQKNGEKSEIEEIYEAWELKEES